MDIVIGAAGKLVFDPAAVNASKGTLLRFSFPGINHTLTQTSFEHSCKKAGAFDTDLNQFNPANISGAFVGDLVVDTTNPQWFFCAQTLKSSHCNAGTMFSLNAREKASAFVEEARTASSHSRTGRTSVLEITAPSRPPASTRHALPSSTRRKLLTSTRHKLRFRPSC